MQRNANEMFGGETWRTIGAAVRASGRFPAGSKITTKHRRRKPIPHWVSSRSGRKTLVHR